MSLALADPFVDQFGNIDWLAYSQSKGVHGFVHPSELALLVQLSEGKNYLEVGSFRGLSAWCVAHVAEHVTCVDTFKANDAGQFQEDQYTTLNEFRRNLEQFESKLTCLPFTSEKAGQLLPEKPNYDVIFLDAMHTYEETKDDIDRWFPRVRNGGYLCIHDYKHDHFPGVQQAVDEAFGPLPDAAHLVTLRVILKRTVSKEEHNAVTAWLRAVPLYKSFEYTSDGHEIRWFLGEGYGVPGAWDGNGHFIRKD